METGFLKQLREKHSDSESAYQRAYVMFTAQFGEDDCNALLKAFVEAMETLLAEVDTHVENHDGISLKRLTHRVIGMCPIYLARETAELAQNIEDELTLGDWAKVEKLCGQMRSSFQRYLGRRVLG
jgi:HPt (histidine-containing phosphotransfer) domain-containing protein